MQLIQLTEPASIDIKNTMSTLEEALEDTQMNGVINDIVNDVCTKISSTKDVKTSKPLEETLNKADKDCNGITKTNGNSQIDHESNSTESEELENSEKKLNGESNGSVSNDSLSSTRAPVSEDTDKAEIQEIVTSKLVEQIKGSEETSNIESTSNLEDNSSENIDPPTSVKHEEVTEGNVPGPLSEKDESIAEVANTNVDDSIPKDIENISPNNIELNSPDTSTAAPEVNEIKHDHSTTLQVPNHTIVAECEESHILTAAKMPIDTTEKETDKSQNEASSTDGLTENNIKTNATEIQESVVKTNKNKEDSIEEIETLNQNSNNVTNLSDIDMDVDKKEQKTMEVEENSEESVLEPSMSVENVTELNNSISPCKGAVNNDVPEVSSEHEKIKNNESIEVDDPDVSIVTPENDKSNNTDKLTTVQNDVEMAVTNSSETSAKERNEEEVTGKETDGVFMEIDDNDEINVVDKSRSESVVESSKDIIKTEVNNPQNNDKHDSVINIIDNDDEENAEDTKKKDNVSEVISIDDNVKDLAQVSEMSSETEEKVMKVVEQILEEKECEKLSKTPEKIDTTTLPIVCKLSNTMDILSDEEDETPVEVKKNICEDLKTPEVSNKCINVDEDDDIMFIEDTNSPRCTNEETQSDQKCSQENTQSKESADIKVNVDESAVNKLVSEDDVTEKTTQISEKVDSPSKEATKQVISEETKPLESEVIKETKQNIITQDFLKSVTKNLADMTRNELEDFCILKLVESVVDKSNLNEIKNKMKTMAQTIEDLRKKALALAKQNRDLQVVVKTVQEDQKKRSSNPMMPMKITRSVGMQVVLTVVEKDAKKKQIAPPPLAQKQVRSQAKPQKPTAAIPVPRLVPASSPTVKSPVAANTTKTVTKTTPQRPEKRPHSKLSPASSVTVDLTDDEPPMKVVTKSQPVRLVPSQHLMAKARPQFSQANASPRKVYIPISPTNQNIRPGAGVIRNFVPTPRARQPSVVRMQAMRLQNPTSNRHPAPLPDAMKQYQPPAWKALPPAPDLKLSKVDNGIVISWKFEGYQPDSYEEVASFQLYAYQETPAPPSTALWKKIGDIKALPLPMACTLTQFMSGFKYYFAVRAIDVRSRIGPFSLPGSIMLISKS